jgi:hypothetical protein
MPVIDRNKNIKFTCSVYQLSNLLKKIKDLTTIDPRVILRIDSNNVLVFSFVGDSFKNIHAFKNYVFPTGEVMTIKKGDMDEAIMLMAKDGKRLYRQLESLLNREEINGKISVNDENYVNYIELDNRKTVDDKIVGTEIKVIGSDPISIGKEISLDDINFLMDINNSTFNFKLSNQDFREIKKLGVIYNEPKSVLYINVMDKNLTIGETLWKVNVDKVDVDDIILSFPKSYFNTINPSDFIHIYVFENFILCKYDDYNLMILLETTI